MGLVCNTLYEYTLRVRIYAGGSLHEIVWASGIATKIVTDRVKSFNFNYLKNLLDRILKISIITGGVRG